jgi:hypothetical protein
MPGFDNLGRVLIVVGLVLAALGLILLLAGRLPFLGRLPGDIAIERDNVSCFFPIATMILLSLLLTVIVNLVLWFLRR